MNHLNLNWLRTFEAVARCSGFTSASKELGLTQTAVSLQIKALEAKVGDKLFIRHAKSLELTEVAKAYLPSVRNSLEMLSLSTNGLFGPDLKNTIVVRTSMACILWLTPRLKEFREIYPGIGIKLVTAIWVESGDTQRADVDIILAPNSHANGNLEKLSDEFLVPVCGLESAAVIKNAEDLLSFNPIHVLGFDDHWARYLSASDLVGYETKSVDLMADTSVAACELAAANLGVAIVIERFARSAVKMGQRVRIVGDPIALEQSHYLSKKETRAEIKASTLVFEEWLREQFNVNG